jgi:hypothetical protein
VCAASNVVSATPATTKLPELPAPVVRPPNYTAFAGFAVLFGALGGALVLLRRRRRAI